MITNLARQLDYSPKAEDLPRVARVLEADLMRAGVRDNAEDSSRVRVAFQQIAVKVGRWPTAYMILEYMPARKEAENNEPRRALPSHLQEYIKGIGMEQKPGESNQDYAIRCCQYMRDNILGDVKVPGKLARKINDLAQEGDHPGDTDEPIHD